MIDRTPTCKDSFNETFEIGVFLYVRAWAQKINYKRRISLFLFLSSIPTILFSRIFFLTMQ